jgi:uncharacterized membrane protein
MKVCTNSRCGAEYLSSVKRQLTISGEMAKKLLNDLSGSVDEYTHDNSSATMDDLIERFGDPKRIADEYISALDQDELRAEIKKSRFIKKAIFFIVIALVLAISITFAVLIEQRKSNIPRYYYDDEIVDDSVGE